MQEKETAKEDIIFALRALQIIGYVIIITIIPIFFFPITIWGLLVSIILLILYVRDLEKKIRKKKKEIENEQEGNKGNMEKCTKS